MLVLFDELLAVVSALEASGASYALCGAAAVAVHGAPRATTDIDVLVAPDDLAGSLAAVRPLGFDVEALPMRFSDGMEVRRVTKIEGADTLTLDILLVNENLAPVLHGRQRMTLQGRDIWVVSREGLIQMKSWAGRPQDLADIDRLRGLDR